MSNLKNINIQDIGDGNDNQKDFYTTFKERLQDVETFPSVYTFKFILPKDEEQLNQIKSIFSGKDAQFSLKESKTGKYNSITVNVTVNDADEVVHYYQEVAKIKGVIML
ncbi:DUF493 domain-containing protein [Sphingobacterium spiritivorum]|uniref:Uncharacterized protein n=2 Tax=Sphingobacterium spiritivorum TaxID=258 RepID=D7VGZ8_SPHSI|nr:MULTISPECIES: DUF493 domain-containing protein [Sphingobacterium]EEI91445.1 hypothetical protein HMPREF0765_2755 [Sphingobacterium spiritivorum ATCC 33300]EFK59350.1 hypothetical protein HMPREF0766_10267 [Sphingobacterium spiritivorum ATCC 33861]QQS97176.1 DUF493 domain-containing protein [Sphingobacterium spiritivorum]QQT33960.1 DUF493 domain-containing protein [Sphingobacterium spiritivorum]WQD34783.1 DUF493 domain-containing protein [Sphingobacterium spiritivorum]